MQRALSLCFVLLVGCAMSEEPVTPELVRVQAGEATVAWTSAEPYEGFVLYRVGTASPEWLRADEAQGASVRHEVVLPGLRPGELVSYRPQAQQTRWELRTPPAGPVPWSLLLVHPGAGPSLADLLADPVELLVVAGRLPTARALDPVAVARPYLPVYDLRGRHSPFLDATEGPRRGAWRPWFVDWGGLRLLFVSSPQDLASGLRAPGAHTLGLVLVPPEGPPAAAGQAAVGAPAPAGWPDRPALSAAIAAHNSGNPGQPIAFVLVCARDAPGPETLPPSEAPRPSEASASASGAALASARWLWLGAGDRPWALRLDVAPEHTRATWRLGLGGEVELRAPPLGVRRTCAQCQRLAQQGDYVAAVAAYREFLRSHDPEHFQVDDAHYAIAEILDQRLFRAGDALAWYGRLLLRYPRSSLTPLATARVAYLQAHADCGYEPLQAFERLRRQGWAEAQGRPTAEDEVIRQAQRARAALGPTCALRPEILYWIANQRAARDPRAAVAAYEELLAQHPGHPHAAQAASQIGETWYAARRFSLAALAFERAALSRPERAAELSARAARARRNHRRGLLALAAAVVLVVLALCLLLPPRRWPTRATLSHASVGAAVLAVGFSLGAWALRAQFWSAAERHGLALGLAGVAGAAALFGVELGLRCVRCGRGPAGGAVRRALVGSAVGVLALSAGAYLLVFLLNEHYLIVVGL